MQSTDPSRERRRDGPQLVFVLAAWLTLWVAAHAFIVHYGPTVPRADDQEFLLAMDPAHGGFSAEWLWRPFNEHRIPATKVMQLGLIQATGSFRAPMHFQAAALGLLALAAILVARRMRGWTSYTDAFFPLLWLHWGNSENLLLGIQITIVMPTIATCTVLMLAAAGPTPPSRRGALAIGACLIAMPLFGASGLTQVPALATWLGLAGLVGVLGARGRSGPEAAERRARGALALGLTAAAALGIALYFVGYEVLDEAPLAKSPGEVLRTALHFVTLVFGQAGEPLWPASIALLGVLVVATLAVLGRAWVTRPEERLRVLGVLACLGASATLALSIGWGRPADHYPGAGWAIRYITLPSPILATLYFAWLSYGGERWRRFVHVVLAATLLALLSFNAVKGLEYGRNMRGNEQRLEADVARGRALYWMAQRHWPWLYPVGAKPCLDRLELMVDMRVPPFDGDYRTGHRNEALGFLGLEVSSASGAKIAGREIDGEPVLLAFPDSALRISLDGATRATGRFGLHPKAVERGATDGVRFVVELAGPGAPTEPLLERTLDPLADPADRGSHAFDVALPPGAGSELVLRTTNAPGRHAADDWSFWADVELR